MLGRATRRFKVKNGYCTLCGTESCVLPNYFICNIIAAVLHFLQAITILILTLSQRIDINIDTQDQYTSWETFDPQKNVTRDDGMTVYFGDMKLRSEIILTKARVSIAWIVICFFLLSAIFQTLVLIDSYEYKTRQDNWLRFVEYSFSASIMLVAIALINGIFNQTVLVFIAVTCAACQLCGLIAEQLLTMTKEKIAKKMKETLFTMAWIAHGTGWLLVGTSYYFILHFYMLSNQHSSTQAPEFVTVIVFSILILFGCFGIVQLLQLTSTINFAQAEFVYVILSLGAKSTLGWIIFANVLVS